jgi:hypothetical protein
VRGELDVLSVTPALEPDVELSDLSPALAPGVSLGYTQQKWGGVATVLVQPTPGLRAEGQFHPLPLGWVRPYLRWGTTAFFGEPDTQDAPFLLGGLSARGALGVDVQLTSRLYAFADVAYEYFLFNGERYSPQSVLFSVGMGLFP